MPTPGPNAPDTPPGSTPELDIDALLAEIEEEDEDRELFADLAA
jgi:hypothetical protein